MAKSEKRRKNILMRKGFYAFLSVIFTLALAAVLALALFFPAMPGEMPQAPDGFEAGERPQMPENFEAGERPQMPENFEAGDIPQMPESFEAGDIPQMPGGNMHGAAGVFALIRGSWLPLALLLGALDLFTVIMYFLLRKRTRKDSKTPISDDEDDYAPVRRHSGSVLLLIVALMAAVVLCISLMPDRQSSAGESFHVEEEVLSAQAVQGSITETLTGGGALAETRSSLFSLAGDIEFISFELANGAFVNEGDVIATVDRASVGKAITGLESIIGELDRAIEASRGETISPLILSPTRGRIKAVHIQKGESIQDAMAEHGALVRLSLDGMMALDLHVELEPGSPATVRLADGTELEAEVLCSAQGLSTLTMSDEKAPYGEHAQAFSADGDFLGEGELYIHSELKIMGYSGTAYEVYAAVDTQAEYEQTLLVLSDTAYPGTYRELLERRRELEEDMALLLEVYESGLVKAPCSGSVAHLNEDALADTEALAFRSTVGLKAPDSAPGLVESLFGLFTDDEDTEKKVGEISGFDYDKQEVVITLLDKSEVRVPVVYMSSSVSTGDLIVLSYTGDELSGVEVYRSGTDSPSGGAMDGPGSVGMGSGMSGGSAMSGGGASATASSPSVGGMAEQGDEKDSYAPDETPVCVITPYEDINVEFTVSELDIDRVRVGKSVRVTLDALPGESFQAVISSVDPNGDSEDQGCTRYSVCATMERSADMLSGMSAAIYMDTAVHQGLCIPVSALIEDADGTWVCTAYDAETDTLGGERLIETAYSDGESVIVSAGLEEGERVYYRYSDSIKYSLGG